MANPEGRKGMGGAANPIGLHGIQLGDQRFYPVEYLDGGLVVAGSQTVFQQDHITHSLIAMDIFHHMIHDGRTFDVTYKTPDDTPLADDETIIFHLTPGTLYPHLVISGTCGGDAQIEFYEDPNVDGDGVAMAERNMNRNSAEPGDVVVVRDPTVNAVGTSLLDIFLPGGTGGQSQGGMLGLRIHSEEILDPDKTYMVRLTNRAGNAQPASLLIQWYEEADN